MLHTGTHCACVCVSVCAWGGAGGRESTAGGGEIKVGSKLTHFLMLVNEVMDFEYLRAV